MTCIKTILLVTVSASVVGALTTAALAQADPQFDPPVNYYSSATGTGSALKTQLYDITRTGFISRSFDTARQALGVIDRDPANSSNIILFYDRRSVRGTWDSGVTWNREHSWPQSLQDTSTPSDSDLHALRPTTPSVNSNRGNLAFGTINANTLPTTFGTVASNNGTGTYFFPGNPDRGDAARAAFYMATRYGQSQTHNLSLKNGQAVQYQMGDLASLLRYHYQDPVDSLERRRNQTVFSQSLNPSFYQNNRNPFVDRPEFVWAIFGTSANDSQISVSIQAPAPAVPTNGATAVNADLGRVIVGSSLATRAVSINKTGTTPTTYDIAVSGSISSTINGTRRAFDYGNQTLATTVSYTGSTSAASLITGTISLNNTDLTSTTGGRGSQDGNDQINITGAILNPSNASFSATANLKSRSLDFGIYAQNDVATPLSFSIGNLASAAGANLTASLDLDSISVTGNNIGGAFFTTLASTSSSLLAGANLNFSAGLLTTALGTFNASFAINNSDENIPGAQNRQSLTLGLVGIVALGGDANLSGSVDFADLVLLARSFNQFSTGTWQTGDFNRDTNVDFGDLVILARNFNSNGAGGGGGESFEVEWARARGLASATVPEPRALAALMGAIVLTLRRRTKVA